MIKLLHSFLQQTPLGGMLTRRRRRDEHRRQLERTRRAAEAARRETQLRVRHWSSPLSAALTEHITRLDTRWQAANKPDDITCTGELERLEAAFDGLVTLGWALWRLDSAAGAPRRWVQELLAGRDAEAATPRHTRHRQRDSAPVADLARLARLAERPARLDDRYQRLASALATAEQPDLVAGIVEPLERGFRQLAEESYPLWAGRFPEHAAVAGQELAGAVVQRLRSHGQPAQADLTAAPAPADSDFEPFDDDAVAPEEKR